MLTQLAATVSDLSDPNAIFSEEASPEIVAEIIAEEKPIEEGIEQMKVGDGFEPLLLAYNASGLLAKKMFLNLLQDNGIVTIVDKDYIYG
jgi:hypothetical protein